VRLVVFAQFRLDHQPYCALVGGVAQWLEVERGSLTGGLSLTCARSIYMDYWDAAI